MTALKNPKHITILAVTLAVFFAAIGIFFFSQRKTPPEPPVTGGESERQTSLTPGEEKEDTTNISSLPVTSDAPAVSKEPEPTEGSVTEQTPTIPEDPTTSKQPDTPAETANTEAAVTTETPETSAPPLTTAGPAGEDTVAALLSSMTLTEKIYQLFIVTPEQLCGVGGPVTEAGTVTKEALLHRPVGGLIFFSGNIKTPKQVTRMLAGQQSFSRLGLFMAVDEEGGTVARLGRNPAMGTTVFPPMGELGASGDPTSAHNAGRIIGEEIKRFGFNLNFAPVADVNSNPKNPVIGSRAFSRDPITAAEMVAACVLGFRESGVLCTLKHFPGHGDTATDSHYGAAVSKKTLAELRECEFLPFAAGIDAGADLVMVGHISLPAVTGDDTPATLSYEIVTGILREELGFDGLIVTDSMSMKAVSARYSSGEAAVTALLSGVDIILMPENLDDAVTGILNAVKSGALSEDRLDESVYRILSSKYAAGIIKE